MSLFFLLMGLEIKREFRSGELSSRKMRSCLSRGPSEEWPACDPVLALNTGTAYARGWAVPVATDIAFSLGILSLLGRRVPRAFRSFLMALAIIDDLGGIIIIAIGYTSGISGDMWELPSCVRGDGLAQ
jgi:NhaA family Na+:H+ antiporter